jgi:hypothetical protein
MTYTPKTNRKRIDNTEACQNAYDNWKKSPHLNLIQATEKFGVTEETFRYFLKKNGLVRPDESTRRDPQSPRQIAIFTAYHEAVKRNEDINFALRFADSKTRSITKGDFYSFCRRNNLAELPDRGTKVLRGVTKHDIKSYFDGR